MLAFLPRDKGLSSSVVPVRTALLVICLAASGCVHFAGETKDVSFVGGDGIELRGTLVLPEVGTRPLPAIILLHGAEPATRKRSIYRKTGNVFLEHGIAVLVYDKRGAGESGGDYKETTYAQLVADAVGAVELLRQRPEIDPARIGIFGVSESGWLTPEIAERSGEIAFVINKVGSALSVRETVAWEVYNDLLADGVSERSAREQTEIYRRIWAYRIAPTPEERIALQETLAEWADRDESQLPTELKEVSASYVADISYDPTPYLERLTTPMLYLYGTEDVNIPTDACVLRLKELVADGKPVSYHVFEGEGHELGGFSLRSLGYRFVDGYAKLLSDFAVENTRVVTSD